MDVPAVDAWPADLGLRVGTSGWAYRHWLGRYYPRKLPSGEMLAWHARRFSTVEVNSTFYRPPTAATVRAWRGQTADGFRVTLKMPRVVTHDKRLVDVEADVEAFLALARELGPKLGVVLVQLPPSLQADLDLLGGLLALLPADVQVAIEMRHKTWRRPEVARMLERHGVARVVHDFGKKATPLAPTAPFAYLRLHGPTGRYRGSYDHETLLAWAEQLHQWQREGLECWCYLNNDERARSVHDALALRSMAQPARGDKVKHEAPHPSPAWPKAPTPAPRASRSAATSASTARKACRRTRRSPPP